MNKKYIGKVISLQFADWKSPIFGVVLTYNDQFTLMRRLEGFRIDGYYIIPHKKGLTFNYGEKEKQTQTIIKLKGYDLSGHPEIALTDIESIFFQVSKDYGALSFYRKWENELYVGRFLSSDAKTIFYDFITSDGIWDGETPVKKKEVRVIEFDTDYVNSLVLYSKHKKQKRTAS
jgi:hypothetical protein